MAEGPFVKVYQSIVDDPMFTRVFDKPVLAQWLRMLLLADATYPASAPMPRHGKNCAVCFPVVKEKA